MRFFEDPYYPPQVSLRPSAPSIEGLPSLSTGWVLLLTVVSYYLYLVWWLYSRSRAINALLGREHISAFFTRYFAPWGVAFNLFCLVDLCLGSVVVVQHPVPVYLTSVAFSACYITWAFRIRSAIVDLSSAAVRPGFLLTLLFGPLYLNYKLRELQELDAACMLRGASTSDPGQPCPTENQVAMPAA